LQVILDVYCRRLPFLGFEVEDADGIWGAPVTVELDLNDGTNSTIVLGLKQVGVRRVRYAYSDWPTPSLRNRIGGLPARVFDIEVAAHPRL
jgi:hypothetical protein